LEYVPKPKKEGADRDDPQPLEQTELQRVIITLDPQPISQAQQEELNLQEEADNREREQKARDTQIKLEEEKIHTGRGAIYRAGAAMRTRTV
jgi:hypothetical protein